MPSFEFEVEYAKSGRAACKRCKDKIDQGAIRVGLKTVAAVDGESAAADRRTAHMMEGTKWHHFECFPQIHAPAWFKKHHPEGSPDVTGLSNLMEADQEKVRELLVACRGEGPVPSAGVPTAGGREVATPAKSAGAGKKRKAEAVEEAGDKPPALTPEQQEAIEAVKAELGKKNAAFLSALLAKNGLAKSGRKDELLDRVAECKTLGVPPICPVCEKAKLKWARSNGVWSCPGHFSDEEKRFVRCKGPAKDSEIVRTPWVELDLC